MSHGIHYKPETPEKGEYMEKNDIVRIWIDAGGKYLGKTGKIISKEYEGDFSQQFIYDIDFGNNDTCKFNEYQIAPSGIDIDIKWI